MRYVIVTRNITNVIVSKIIIYYLYRCSDDFHPQNFLECSIMHVGAIIEYSTKFKNARLVARHTTFNVPYPPKTMSSFQSTGAIRYDVILFFLAYTCLFFYTYTFIFVLQLLLLYLIR